jgi:hypothetical protein
MKAFFIAILLMAGVVVVAPQPSFAAKCGDVEVAIDVGCAPGSPSDPQANNPIIQYLRGIIKFLSGLVGLAVVGNIIVGGIQYITSQGEPANLTKAKTRIAASVISLIVFLFSVGILNYLIPGRVFG